nr:MAG TPA: hypothetical protein [Caudoviricetes sp.]DAV03023.1 MAG TPA: hypothetical protein [Caudoviricetes sp.]
MLISTTNEREPLKRAHLSFAMVSLAIVSLYGSTL